MNVEDPIIKFIKEHISNDLATLAFNKNKYKNIDFTYAIQQIGARQKAKNKLPDWSKNFNLIFPSPLSLEQSSSEQSAKFKASLFSGDHLIDLSAGFGVDAFYLSQNFFKTTLVEPQYELCQILKHNGQQFCIPCFEIVNSEAKPFLERYKKKEEEQITFYLDPDRRGKAGEKLVKITDCEPNIMKIKSLLLAQGAQIIIKLSPMLDLKQLIQTIPEIKEIIIIGVQNECKELLAVIKTPIIENETLITAIQLKNEEIIRFEFSIPEETNCIPVIASTIKKYLYEPNPSIMKSGGFKMVSTTFNIDKIDYHSHLYTSDQYVKNFPGRCFQVIDYFGFTKEEVHTKINKGGFYNLSTRNFPIETEKLRKQLKIKEGGENYLFATTMNQKHLLILCHKC